MTRLLILGLVLLSVAGCSRIQGAAGALGVGNANANRAQVEREGVRYRARAHAESEDKRDFAITVTPVAVNPEGAIEVGRYAATRYCLLTFGGSDKDWTSGPDKPIEELAVSDDTVTLLGRCTQR